MKTQNFDVKKAQIIPTMSIFQHQNFIEFIFWYHSKKLENLDFPKSADFGSFQQLAIA